MAVNRALNKGQRQAAPVKEDKLPQAIDIALNTLLGSINELNNKPGFKQLPANAQAIYLSICVSTTLAYKVADVTTDGHPGLFFDTHVKPFITQVTSALNEKVVIDTKFVLESVFPFWTIRHGVVAGEFSPLVARDTLSLAFSGPKASLINKYLDFIKG